MVSTTTPTGNATDIAVGKLALEFCDKALPLRVLRSQRGFYIGTLNGRLAHALGQFGGRLPALAVAIHQVRGHIAGEQRELEQLLHHIDHPVVVGRGLHTASLIKLLVSLGHGRLVGDGHHPHPATQHAQLVDRIK